MDIVLVVSGEQRCLCGGWPSDPLSAHVPSSDGVLTCTLHAEAQDKPSHSLLQKRAEA